jgi:phosphohistidine phosphatase
MNIYFMRHGIAAPATHPGLLLDRQRSLTARGKSRIRKIAAAMKAMGLSFDCILSSPLRRARQTADIVARELSARDQLILTGTLAAGQREAAVLKFLAGMKPRPKNVLLVGHEPQLSGLVSLCLAGTLELRLELKKGGLCKLVVHSWVPGQRAVLAWLLTPKQMIRRFRTVR